MINKKMLLSKMVAKGENQVSMAAKMEVSKNTFNAKINGKGFFNTKEISRICDILEIVEGSEKVLIFLAESSQNRDDA